MRGCLRARKHPSKETEVHAESLVGVRCSRNSAEALVAFAAVEIPLRRTFAFRCSMKLMSELNEISRWCSHCCSSRDL